MNVCKTERMSFARMSVPKRFPSSGNQEPHNASTHSSCYLEQSGSPFLREIEYADLEGAERDATYLQRFSERSPAVRLEISVRNGSEL